MSFIIAWIVPFCLIVFLFSVLTIPKFWLFMFFIGFIIFFPIYYVLDKIINDDLK